MLPSEKKDKFNEILQMSRKYARENKICLNSNKKIVESLINALIKREEKYGQRYCPCRVVSDNQEKNKDIICPCQSCLDEIKQNGHCHCFLFTNCQKR